MNVKKIILVVNNSPANYLNLRRIFNLPMDLLVNFCVNNFITGSKYNSIKMSKLITIDKKKILFLMEF